ncbi:hypothetical protein [Luteococcus sp.]|uniref:hypothetical protein n=1 Tax=Luteococcus sp. TaxID=1969402 RepID=UPI0037364A29
MPVCAAQDQFAAAATAAGLHLERATAPWLNRQGHFALPDQCRDIIPILEQAFILLGGDQTAQRGKTRTPLPGDLMDPDRRIMIETDEVQHFTTHRLATLDLIPNGYPLGYDPAQYRRLCHTHHHKADNYYRRKNATGFGPGGRQRQRAYNDLLRDLAAPCMGWTLIRIPILDADGTRAFTDNTTRLTTTNQLHCS